MALRVESRLGLIRLWRSELWFKGFRVYRVEGLRFRIEGFKARSRNLHSTWIVAAPRILNLEPLHYLSTPKQV